jgi:hypothetical protein
VHFQRSGMKKHPLEKRRNKTVPSKASSSPSYSADLSADDGVKVIMPSLTKSIGKEGKERLKSTVYAKEDSESVEMRRREGMKEIVIKSYGLPFSSDLINFGLDDKYEIPFPQRPFYDDLMKSFPGSHSHAHDVLEASGASILHEREEKVLKQWLDDIYSHYKREQLNQFEHNLNVWRELWYKISQSLQLNQGGTAHKTSFVYRRAIEISHIAIITADIRNPLLFIPKVLYTYLTHDIHMPLVIVLTKCDLVPKDVSFAWRKEIKRR